MTLPASTVNNDGDGQLHLLACRLHIGRRADQLWSPVFAAFDVDAELPIEEVQAEHAWGFVRGTYALRLVPADGGDPMVEEGRYIDVVEKDAEGGWKIARAIWNTTES